MRASAVAGLVLANSNDELLNELTSVRSMASVPFGGRYRLIDFTLSNLVHSGVSSVGLITKENYRSLMDHIGNGFYWDLDRKGGGVYLLPPYVTSGVRRYTGTIDALYGAMNFLKRSKADYIVISGSDTIANIDISAAIESHINKQADITVVYHYGKKPVNHDDIMILDLDNDNRIKSVNFKSNGEDVSVLTGGGHEVQLATCGDGQHDDSIGGLILDLIVHGAGHVCGHTLQIGGDETDRADGDGTLHQIVHAGGGDLAVEGVDLLMGGVQLALELGSLGGDVGGVVHLQLLGGGVDEVVLLVQESQHARTRHSLDTAHACGHGGLGDDLEETDLTRVVHVSTAAQLDGAATHAHHAHGLAVLLTEQSHSAQSLGLVDAHLGHGALTTGQPGNSRL